jgi:glycosyltransferase involved in cell wall biosynthesis
MSKIKVVIVTNVPAPYRVPVWQRVAQAENIDLQLVFCGAPHIDTHTKPADYGFKCHFLPGRYFAMQRRFLHFDFSIWAFLNQLQADIVITTGYIPTFLVAFAWVLFKRKRHIVMTDGTAESEQTLTGLHRWVRRFVFARSEAFVGACEGSLALFKQYGVPEQAMHLAYLCADNQKFTVSGVAQTVDFIFCGRFLAHKQPFFALLVAQQVARRLGRKTSIDFVGSGVLEQQLRQLAESMVTEVDCRFLGYASQDELPLRYAAAKIFLFPSEWDPWGVVANEACAAGLATIVSPYPGVVVELLIDGYNAYVRELELDQWTTAAVELLTDSMLYQQFSQNSRLQVAKYSYDNSAQGLIAAIRQVS